MIESKLRAGSALLAGTILSAALCATALADGQPDLQGNWTNATITPFERPEKFGERLVQRMA